jgi:hypothetical protein
MMKKLMKKSGLLVCLMLIFLVAFQVSSVSAVSSGYERYKDNDAEIRLEYLPIVPYNPSQPTASEEFAIKFHLWQRAWLHGPWWALRKMVPRGFKINVYYRDDTCGYPSNYVTWKRWLPTSTGQYGLTFTWRLSGGYPPLSLSGSVDGPSVFGYNTNYNKYSATYYGIYYCHVADLEAEYRSYLLWGNTHVDGGGSIGIPNDVAQSHQGNHALVWVKVTLVWIDLDAIFGTLKEKVYRYYNFILGDDIPSDTDCWLTIQQGDTNFALS